MGEIKKKTFTKKSRKKIKKIKLKNIIQSI